MRQTSVIRQTLLGIVGSVTTASLIGCQVPGGSFGCDPLQIRFAEAVKVSLEVGPATDSEPRKSFERTAASASVILASQSP